MILTFVILQVLSLAFMAALLYKFHYLHKKTLSFLSGLHVSETAWNILEWQMLSVLYIIATTGILAGTSVLFFIIVT